MRDERQSDYETDTRAEIETLKAQVLFLTKSLELMGSVLNSVIERLGMDREPERPKPN